LNILKVTKSRRHEGAIALFGYFPVINIFLTAEGTEGNGYYDDNEFKTEFKKLLTIDNRWKDIRWINS